MEIDVTHHIESSGPCQDGFGWHYEFHLFRFTEPPLTLIARSYVHSPEEVHFLSLQEKQKTRLLRQEDLELPLFQQAMRHLRESGKTSINWLADCGYKPL
jgi:hypothetical protein